MLSYIVIHSDEGLTLETSVLETLHGGQFTLSTQLIKYKFEKKANYDDAPFTRKKTIGETDLKMKWNLIRLQSRIDHLQVQQ